MTTLKTHRVILAPSLKEIALQEGKSILDGAREIGVFIDSQCNGKGKCGKCRVRIIDGSASPFTEAESDFIGPTDRAQGYRLACMARVTGDLTVLIPEENLLSSEASRKLFSKRSAVIDPAVKSYTLDLPDAPVNVQQAYFERIADLLEELQGLKALSIDIAVLRQIARVVKESGGRLTVYVWMDREIIAVSPHPDAPCLGLALDVGTTTVALYLIDLKDGSVIASASATNPQVLFGTDIMSRISYSSHQPGEGVRRMQRELVRSVNGLARQMAENNDFATNQIMDMTMVGNTVMHHIFLGIAPDHLGLFPFSPSIHGSVDVKVRELGIDICPSAYAHVLPVEAGFVGADNVAVLLSETPYNRNEISLVIDLGTNGELVLGNRDGLLSCSCATGPALEGAHIASGMRATKGAIEKVRIDPSTFEADYAVIGTDGWASEYPAGELKPIGICGSGIIDTVAHLFKSGLIGGDGAFKLNGQKTERLRKGRSGVTEYVLAWKSESATGDDIVLSQKDVRQIQLAKGALQGGCRVLMQRLQVETIPRMVIAGAFGMHIDKENALTIGLFPWCEPERIAMVGNAAGHGAYLALVDRAKRAEAGRIAREVEHIELAMEEGFQKEFVKSLSIPYKEDR
jgi:uncharacterized 2Fe-2S/4Fe-4S cluster protein (DUF4445 family)